MRILILIFFLALSITANAECEVNGYYRANGTWVNGYTKSGDCWNGKVIGYDSEGRTAKERRAIQVQQNRIIIPFILLLIIFLAIWGDKLAEGSRLKILTNIILYPAILYLMFMTVLDPIVIVLIIFGFVAWNWLKDRKEKKKAKQISEKKKNYLSTTAISDINNIKNKFQLFDYLLKNNLIYRENNSYKLTEEGVDIGGEYRSNKNGLQWIVWKKDCLDEYIDNLKTLKSINTDNVQQRTIRVQNIQQTLPLIEKNLKSFWKNIYPFLDSNGINKFYHFTDKRNLRTIIDNGGLYSWDSLKKKNIYAFTSSNELSRNLDIQHGLEDYVRLSFANYNPMSSRVMYQDKRELIWLEIDRSVALLEDTLFSNVNATDKYVKISSDFNFLKSLNFRIFNKRWNTLNSQEKKEYQAEILVKEFLPIKYITNINTLRQEYL